MPVDEKLMGELIFNIVMTLPPLPTREKPHSRKRKGRKSQLRMKKLEVGEEIFVKCSRVVKRREKSKEIVLLSSK